MEVCEIFKLGSLKTSTAKTHSRLVNFENKSRITFAHAIARLYL